MCGFEVGAVEPWPADPRTPGGAPDAVLDLEITTNRPDCLSVLGIAREVATAWDTGLRMPPAADAGSDPGAAREDEHLARQQGAFLPYEVTGVTQRRR